MDYAWQVLHKEFHQKIISACNCEPMLRISSDLHDSTELYRCWAAQLVAPEIRDVEGEHQAIVDAVLARNAEAAAHALRVHYEATVEVVLKSGLADEVVSAS